MKTAAALCTLLLLTILPLQSNATILAEHIGDNDPATEGWLFGTGPSNVQGPINDGGVLAWMIDDNSSSGGGGGCQYNFTAQEIIDANTMGWRMEVRLRAVDSPSPLGSPMAFVRINNRDYRLHFANNSVRLITSGSTGGTDFPVSPGYHTYELQFDAGTQTATFRIDGNVVHTGYVGTAWVYTPSMGWMAGSTPDTGQGNFSYAAIEITDPPVSVEEAIWGSVKALFR